MDFTFQIDPGPVVVIYARGYNISRGVLKKEIPVYEENAVDDDLLNEGKRNLLDYLQTRGHFDAKVDIQKETDAKTLRVIYQIDPGPLHKLVLVEITGNKDFLDTAKLRSYLQIQPASRFAQPRPLQRSPAQERRRHSGRALPVERLSRGQDQDQSGRQLPRVENKLAVHIHIDEGVRTLRRRVACTGHTEGRGQRASRTDHAARPAVFRAGSGERSGKNPQLLLRSRISQRHARNHHQAFSRQAQSRRRHLTRFRKGERFTVNRVMVAGTEHTRDYVVQRELQVHDGDPLSQQDLLDTQTRLYDLGIFSQVDTAVQNPEGTDPQKNVLVQVQEAKRYTFTYGVGLEFQTGQPAGTTAPQGTTGVSPRVEFDVTRLNVGGRNQTLTFQSHVGRLQQRGLISYAIPKLFDNEKFKLIYTDFLRQQSRCGDVHLAAAGRERSTCGSRSETPGIEPGTPAGPNSITYRWDFRLVKAEPLCGRISLPAKSRSSRFRRAWAVPVSPLSTTSGTIRWKAPREATSRWMVLPHPSYFGSEADFGRALGAVLHVLCVRRKRQGRTSVRVCPLDHASAWSSRSVAPRFCLPDRAR